MNFSYNHSNVPLTPQTLDRANCMLGIFCNTPLYSNFARIMMDFVVSYHCSGNFSFGKKEGGSIKQHNAYVEINEVHEFIPAY